MVTLRSAMANIQEGDYSGFIDLKGAYFSAPV